MVLPRFAGVRPSGVRPCAVTEDVAEALAAARRAAQPVAVRSGGHCFAGRSSTTGVVIDVSPMTGVEVDGDRAVNVFGAAPSTAAVDDLIARLGARPSSDDRHHGTHQQTKQWLSAGDGTPDPRWAYLHSEFFRDPIPAGPLLDRLREDRRPGEERELDFTPWGGAYNRVPADATAFPHRDARFLLKQTATVSPDDRPGPWLDDSYALTHPYGTGGAYPNFPDPALATEAYYLANTPRRAQIRARYDPEAVFGP